MEHQSVEGQNMAQEQQQGATQQQEPSGQQPGAAQQPEEKLFTQEEVNKIVRERLARAKNLPDTSEHDRREQALNERELRLDAREKLADAEIPKELLPLVKCGNKEEMEESIKLISTYFKNSSDRPYRIMSTGVGSGPSSVTGKETGSDEIRKAMGLKGR